MIVLFEQHPSGTCLIVRLCGYRNSETYITTTDELKNQLTLKADTLTTDRAALAGFTLRVQSLSSGKVNGMLLEVFVRLMIR